MQNSDTKNKFGSQVKEYNKYRSQYPREFYDFLFSLVKIKKVENILDIGCGTGKSTEPLVRGNAKVIGYDHDSRMLKQARSNALEYHLPIEYIKGEAEDLPFEDNSFDVVTIGTAFHWFANKKVVENIERILKPDGLLFIHWKQIGKEDVRLRKKIFSKFYQDYKGSGILITPEEVIDFLKNQGFQKIENTKKSYKSNYNLESAVGRLKTVGYYFRLSPKQKIEFEDIATKVFSDYLNKKNKIEFGATTQIVYAYKKNK